MSNPEQFFDEVVVIATRFQTIWNNRTPIRFENTDWTNPDGSWVSLTVRTGLGDQIELRENALHRYPGVVIIQVFQKERTGTAECNKLAGQIADVFRRLETCRNDGTNCKY